MKDIKSSKTIVFNVLALIVALAGIFGFGEFAPSAEVQESISAVVVFVAAAVPVINIILRLLTNTAVGIFGKSLVKSVTFGDLKGRK